jgi:hypothetical protein
MTKHLNKFFSQKDKQSRFWGLTSIILAIQEIEIRRTKGQSQPGQTVYLKKPNTKMGLVEWLKV